MPWLEATHAAIIVPEFRRCVTLGGFHHARRYVHIGLLPMVAVCRGADCLFAQTTPANDGTLPSFNLPVFHVRFEGMRGGKVLVEGDD